MNTPAPAASPAPDYSPVEPIKMLYLGDSGSGKTGSLAALAAIGYNVYIADCDKGAAILVGPKGYLHNPDSLYCKPRPGLWTAEDIKGIAGRVHARPISEEMSLMQGRLVARGKAWEKLQDTIINSPAQGAAPFKGGWPDRGPLDTWTSRDVIVIDSLSRASDFALYQQLTLTGRALKGPEQQDWWPAQRQISHMLLTLCSDVVRCHVIVIAHIKYIEKDNSITRGMPQTLGKALSPEVGQQFNHAILAQSTGQGTGLKHKILTRTTGVIDLKSAAPLAVKPEYDLETGLAEYFLATLGPLCPAA